MTGALCSAAAYGFPFGSGTCDASADGSFMSDRTHHPGASGGFRLVFGTPDFYPGERLGLRLEHSLSEVYSGFLIYAETATLQRDGWFEAGPGTALKMDCDVGPTLTHDAPGLHPGLDLRWTAPPAPATDMTFRALVLRADPIAQRGTDFYEVTASLPVAIAGVFRDRFETLP